MIPRTFGLAAVCVFCLVQMVAADTRISISGGAEISTDFSGYDNAPLALHLQAIADAPPWIRKHVPLELAVGFTGPYPDEHVVVEYDAWGPSPHYNYWSPHYRFSEAVRIYGRGRNTPNRALDGMEIGVGFGNHQIVSRLRDQDIGQVKKGMRVETQWRAELVLRTIFLPSRTAGPVLELDVQRALERTRNDAAGTAVVLSLGWRFRV